MRKSEAPGGDCVLPRVLQGVWPQITWRLCDVEHSYIYATLRGEPSAGEEHRVSSLQPLLISGGQVSPSKVMRRTFWCCPFRWL